MPVSQAKRECCRINLPHSSGESQLRKLHTVEQTRSLIKLHSSALGHLSQNCTFYCIELSRLENNKDYLVEKLIPVVKEFIEKLKQNGILLKPDSLEYIKRTPDDKKCMALLECLIIKYEIFQDEQIYQALIQSLQNVGLVKPADVLNSGGGIMLEK